MSAQKLSIENLGGMDELAAARLLLEKLGFFPTGITQTKTTKYRPPTFVEYTPVVSEAVSEGTRRVYGTYWNRLVEHWGDRPITEPSPSEIQQLAEVIRRRAVIRHNSRDGRSAAEHFIAATRCLYRHAVADGIVQTSMNPATKVAKPRRLASNRHAISDDQLAEINRIAASTGNDTELDTLLLRLHTETGCRRGGALALRPRDLDPEQSLILLREKGGTHRWQPVSPTLMTHLLTHSSTRTCYQPNQQLLRYRSGRAITRRRYDYLWTRIGSRSPWVRTHGVTTHWLRHTTLTWVERNYGYAIARAYAGHNDTRDNATMTYVKASVRDIATALAELTNEPHPLAQGSPPLMHRTAD